MQANVPMLALALAASAALAAPASSLRAQDSWKPELHPFVGTSIPTGTLRNVAGSETLYGVQAAAELRPWLHVLGTVGWAPGETRHVATDRRMHLLQYDAGAEVSGTQSIWLGLKLHPFWGAGAGARTYLYDSNALKDRTCLSGYASTGLEVQAGRTALRAEVRDNVLCYRSPVAGARSGTRNDLNLMLGLAYHFR